MTITRYHAIAGLVVFLLLIAVFLIPDEYAGIGDMNNSTNETPEIEQMPLMSSPDDIDDRPGWWKSKGRSTVTTSNRSSDTGTGENNNGKKENEIPEFPHIVLPVIVVLCISMIHHRK
ncbi:MAG: hypothetical protein QCH31_08170 [Methanolobus sp.]|nr:hypothetical protein [Methanolobus sp.]